MTSTSERANTLRHKTTRHAIRQNFYSLQETHVREGFVVRPLQERFHPKLGRVILKLHGEDYLLGKQLQKGKKG